MLHLRNQCFTDKPFVLCAVIPISRIKIKSASLQCNDYDKLNGTDEFFPLRIYQSNILFSLFHSADSFATICLHPTNTWQKYSSQIIDSVQLLDEYTDGEIEGYRRSRSNVA